MPMELTKKTPKLLQFGVIVLMSVAASYAFQHTETVYQSNGICFYRYLTYFITIFLSYACFSYYKKSIAFLFSLGLSAMALSPFGLKAIEFFPSAVPLLAMLMGVTTVLLVPSAKGRGFLEYLAVLILPAVLAESLIGGSLRLLETAQSIAYYELSAITVIIVGGYLYLRYTTLAHLSHVELLSRGTDDRDTTEAGKRSNIMIAITVASASAIAISLMVTAPLVADALHATGAAAPLYVLALAMGAGMTIIAIFYIFQLSQNEPSHVRFR